MKIKKCLFILLAIFLAGTIGCAFEDGIDRTQPVFATDNISGITFYTSLKGDYLEEIKVPDEHMEEIVSWLGSFRIGTKAGDTLIPGTNSVELRIEYADGTVVESGISAVLVDGAFYYLDCENAPQCYLELVS